MSGHSKWANIKHKKAKGDAVKGKIFTKLGRELAVAVKAGGADPSSNSKLYDVIAKAKANNMPNDNIARSIKKASGELGSINYESIIYEGYGVAGSAVIVEALTDNKNRTAGEVRCAFDKNGGSMGTTNCVSFMFDRFGVIIVERTVELSEDDIFELAINCGADNVEIFDDVFEVYTSVANYNDVKSQLIDAKMSIVESSIQWIPQNTITLTSENVEKFNHMLEVLEDSDDVQDVYHNVLLPDETEEE